MPELREVEMSTIDEPDLPLREAMDEQELEGLKESMRAIGLGQPLTLKVRGDRYEIEDGHRRFVAATQLKWRTIRAIVYQDGEMVEHATKLHLNLFREENTAAEHAMWLAQLLQEKHHTLEQLMRITGMGEEWINQRLALMSGDADVFNAVRKREINFSQARELNMVKDELMRRDYLGHAIRGGAPARRIREWRLQLEAINLPPQTEQATPAVPTNGTAPPPPAIACVLCGGFRDTYNMQQVWIHNWELQELIKLRERAAQGE